MNQSPSVEANMLSASQEIPCVLWNLKVHLHMHRSTDHHLSQSSARSVQSLLLH